MPSGLSDTIAPEGRVTGEPTLIAVPLIIATLGGGPSISLSLVTTSMTTGVASSVVAISAPAVAGSSTETTLIVVKAVIELPSPSVSLNSTIRRLVFGATVLVLT